MGDEVSWEEEGGATPGRVSKPLELPEGFALVVGEPLAAQWVRTPPELGARKLYIKSVREVHMRCPMCDTRERPMSIVGLEENVGVICCPICKQYGWIKHALAEKEDS